MDVDPSLALKFILPLLFNKIWTSSTCLRLVALYLKFEFYLDLKIIIK
jgi:hypothetical protein